MYSSKILCNFLCSIVFILGINSSYAQDANVQSLRGKIVSIKDDYFVVQTTNGQEAKILIDQNMESSNAFKYKIGQEVSIIGESQSRMPGGLIVVGKTVDHSKDDYLKRYNKIIKDSKKKAVWLDGHNNEITGVVKDIDDDYFTLEGSDGSQLHINIKEMSYNPLDDEGYIKLKLGDRVRVYGRYEENFFFPDELHASWIITFKQK